MPAALPPLDIHKALPSLPGWEFVGSSLQKTFVFRDFSQALAFIVRVGVEAERINHHPRFTNVWNRVDLSLNTHDAGNQVTQLDLDLAAAIERLAD